MLECCELFCELLDLLTLLGRWSGRGVRTGVGSARWDRLWGALAGIGLTTPGVLPALVYGYWVNSPSIAATDGWGRRGQLHRWGLTHRHRDIGACCGPVSEEGHPVACRAVIDLVHRTGLDSRRSTHRIRITDIRSNC